MSDWIFGTERRFSNLRICEFEEDYYKKTKQGIDLIGSIDKRCNLSKQDERCDISFYLNFVSPFCELRKSGKAIFAKLWGYRSRQQGYYRTADPTDWITEWLNRTEYKPIEPVRTLLHRLESNLESNWLLNLELICGYIHITNYNKYEFWKGQRLL